MLSLAMALRRPSRSCCCIDELSLGLAPTVVGQLLEIGARRSTPTGTTVVVVEQSVNVALLLRRAGRVPGEGRGPLHGPDRRACSTGPTSSGRCSSAATAAAADGEPAGDRPTPSDVTAPCEPASRASRSSAAGLTKRFGGITRRRRRRPRASRRARSSGSSATTAPARRRCSTCSPGSSPADGGQVRARRHRRHRRWPPHRRAVAGLGPLVPGGPALPVADRRRDARRRARAPPRQPRPAGRRASACRPRPTSRGGRRPSGSTSCIELLGLGRVPRPAHRRAVDRHPPHRRAGVPARPATRRCCCSTSRRPAWPSARPRRSGPLLRRVQAADRLLAGRHRARHGAARGAVRRARGPRARRGHRRRHPAEVLADPAVVASYLGTERGRRPPLGDAAGVVLHAGAGEPRW